MNRNTRTNKSNAGPRGPLTAGRRHTAATRSWLDPRLVLKRSKTHGRGVFASTPIRRRERLAIFGGDVMFIDEIDRLPQRLQEYPMQIEERFVLGDRSGSGPEPPDYFNHSCDPNAGFSGQIFLVAMRRIRAGEEVCFDYGMVVSQSVGSDIVFEMECRCRTKRCRHMVTEDDWRRPDLRRRYAGFFSQYIQDKIDAERLRTRKEIYAPRRNNKP